jgi:hypothetical protein
MIAIRLVIEVPIDGPAFVYSNVLLCQLRQWHVSEIKDSPARR